MSRTRRKVISIVAIAVVTGAATLAWIAAHGAYGQSTRRIAVSTSATPTPGKQCAAPTPNPVGLVQWQEPAQKLPADVWINPALGANLRLLPEVSARWITTIPRGVHAIADQKATDKAGADWSRIRYHGQTGWVRNDLLWFEPIGPYGDGTTTGWSVMVPLDTSFGASSPTPQFQWQVGSLGGPYWFILLDIAPDIASLPPEQPFIVAAEYPALYERHESVSVWKYSAIKRTVRASFICQFPPDLEQRTGGWTYVTSVRVQAPKQAYQFLFATDSPDMPIINKVLDSAILN